LLGQALRRDDPYPPIDRSFFLVVSPREPGTLTGGSAFQLKLFHQHLPHHRNSGLLSGFFDRSGPAVAGYRRHKDLAGHYNFMH
jgi:hypothetical protein